MARLRAALARKLRRLGAPSRTLRTGYDLRPLPLRERKAILRAALTEARPFLVARPPDVCN